MGQMRASRKMVLLCVLLGLLLDNMLLTAVGKQMLKASCLPSPLSLLFVLFLSESLTVAILICLPYM